MKAVVVQNNKTVKVEEKPKPSFERNELLLKVVAVGINPTDWKHVAGGMAKPGDISGCDFVGEVAEIGYDVPSNEVNKGELRWGSMRGGQSPERGGFAEYVPVEWDLSSVVPSNITPQEAASVPIPYMTAVQALFLRLKLPQYPENAKDAPWILIWSGATSVGQYAVQLAKLSGLRVATTASKSRWDHLRSLGADVIVDYKDSDAPEKLKTETNNAIVYGLDCISENGTIQQAQSAFGSSGGHLVCVRFMTGEPARADVKTESTIVYTALGKDAVHVWPSIIMRTSNEDRSLYVKWAMLSTKLFHEGKVKPLSIEIVGSLEDAQTAMDMVKNGKHSTKLILNVA